ncbi:16S rRNA (cytosine(967)-C(5))-methyltransferase RsmB [Cognatilysobacter terrigena]|uniref:16S rRNA (cytosine(967)-C(5))-methyltransferase RsmB n=1 Tax=Cognatilysobacter terrigena TaxID=2488749 RepID=UPI0010606F59|nr:16S rRNA (cytosine(967)-C(5))-methyltransferase RsmB [Lysobacter terrigena]
MAAREHASTNAPGIAPRLAAARVLDAVLHRHRSLRAELGPALSTLADPRDRALTEAIVLAVLRAPSRYAAALDAWMPKPLPRRDGAVRALLMVGLAQLDPLALPAHAAVASTVDAMRASGQAHRAGLANALLRRAQRDGVPMADARAHWPGWLRARIEADWPGDVDAIFDASTHAPPMWLRVNRQRITRDDYLARLAEVGIEALADDVLPDALRLAHAVPVSTLPGFDDGLVTVQDASAQAVADALAPKSGARALDACAAPGGKTTHLLERDPSLAMTAIDVDAARLAQVEKAMNRLGFGDRARLIAADAADVATWWDGTPFDAVLLDAPCSATGIVRRQPDVVLHRRESDLDALVALQAKLLDALWTTVAPGGVLLYATCSILRDENERQVDAFLARTPDAVAEPLDARFGRESGVGRQVLPGERGRDGFFYARLVKR